MALRRMALAALHEARGAQWEEHLGWEVPGCYSGVPSEHQALHQGVGLIDLSHRQRVLLSGRDRKTWLNGQCTQNVLTLEDFHLRYATIISPQGQMVADVRIIALPDALLLDLPAGTTAPMAEYLERYLIMERADVEDISEGWAHISAQGPLAAQAAALVLTDEIADLPLWTGITSTFELGPLHVFRISRCGEDGFEFFVPTAAATSLWTALCVSRPELAVQSVGKRALNVRRVEAGVPWWGSELDGTIVPLEARLEHAIDYNKGCYVGQEIIARIHARGHVNNQLAGFFFEGDTPPPKGSEIHHEGKKVGRTTSAVHSLTLDRGIGLGFLRRELQEPGTEVTAMTEAGEIPLTVAALPFVPHDCPQVPSAA